MSLGSPPTEEATIRVLDDDPERGAALRRRADRRNRPTHPWIGLRGPRRRSGGRRASDQTGYVDRYSRYDVALILAVFLMNVADAFFTMLWLDRGGKEANPVMDFFLDIGPTAFLIQKCIVVGAWLLVLLVHKNFRFARLGLHVSLLAYAALTFLHFGILASGIEPRDAANSDKIQEDSTSPDGGAPQQHAVVVDERLQALIERVDRLAAE
jgi:hypothetical protein